jgi:cell wall-associated NlpC family hydrolase
VVCHAARMNSKRALVTLALLASLLGGVLTAAPSASATTAKRTIAMNWAVDHTTGCWYYWGGAGCSPGYDCSGVVYRAYRYAGFAIPRTTYEMLSWWRARRTYHPARGDLAFYGSGHVELMGRTWGYTFGALQSGTRVGWHHWNSYWHPTEFIHVYGAG